MYEKRRQQMVEKFVAAQGVSDERILKAMAIVPRHLFVEPVLVHSAYGGKALPIGFGQTISHPTTVAWMTNVLELTGGERVLEIGTGSGYQAVILAEMGIKVYSIERIPQLARRAQEIFDKLGYYSIAVQIGDGSLGWTAHAPYDRIIQTAASPQLPTGLLSQLKPGGRLVAPVGEKSSQKLMVVTQRDGESHILGEYSRQFVPLIGRNGWTE